MSQTVNLLVSQAITASVSVCFAFVHFLNLSVQFEPDVFLLGDISYLF